MKNCILVGVPMDCGKRRDGCLMGPDALRVAGLADALGDLDLDVEDIGNIHVAPQPHCDETDHVYKRQEVQAWTETLAKTAQEAAMRGTPIFMGGDHALSLGTGLGIARYAKTQNRPLFVMWLDAHTDYHTPHTTDSGNLHGTPLAYISGKEGFEGFPKFEHPVAPENTLIFGLRSVDGPERAALQESRIQYYDMRAIDEIGVVKPMRAFLDRVAQANGLLHVSFDVDFLDPSFAPAVGTTVPGGATIREAHLIMELIHDSGLMTSLDLVELNPFLDERGRTAQMMVDFTASAFGRRVFDRNTRSYY